MLSPLLATRCAAEAVHPGGTLTVALSYDLDTLNVYATGFLGDVEAAVVEGLVAPDSQARYRPVLATTVPTIGNGGIVLDPDGRMHVTYHLRAGVCWQDGAPFTAADVKFTWEAVRDPAFLAESKDGSEDIEGIDTPDDLTVVVNYRHSSAAFASTLFTFGILPRHLLLGHDLNHDPYNTRPIGTGPFMVREFRRGEYVALDRNPHYWQHDSEGRQLPYLDRIVFRIVPDSNTLGTLIRAGEIGLAPLIPYMLAKQLQGTRGIEIVRGPSLGWEHLDFSFKGPPALRDPTVRRAIAQAIDRRILVRAAGGFPLPIRSVVVPTLTDLYDPMVPVLAYDPAQANRLLDDAGYARGPDGIRARDGQRLSFSITAQTGQIDDEIAEQIIIAELRAIGIRLSADNKSGISFRQARYRGAYDLLYGRWVTAADPVYSVFYGTHGPNNGQGYASPELDEAMRRLETEMHPEPRRQDAAAMQAILARDLPTIPLLSTVSVNARSDRLRGYVPNPTNMTDFVGAASWWLAPASMTATLSGGRAP
ncbi:peptide ABC transporter substrate-binding protein (plasmid) [Lichenicola cladoniae]|uniref:Peptide ABC transporter substrate-binding protein n=2 Tax=Lichenicola cladoniae TaxID=1484109 RepID=A0A6M8HYJ1_9PROT|nr:peptide ABC transporter substrate-binding protein [Acetobacteraceae bacterium]QKE93267.1 peptide ABC transporter substrate-binding protein [Lichenicola cladoniae]